MASRRLAYSFNQALRSRKALSSIQPIKRGFATPLEPTQTECTTLSNGLTIATQHSPWAQTSTVGVWIDAGSRAETDKTNGTAHFLEHLAFKGTNKRSQQQLELEIENMGGHLNAYTSRENTVYYAKSFNSDVPRTVDILSDILQNSKLEPSAVERERDVILREQEEVDKQLDEVVFDHLHATAYQNQPLGRTILGPKENIASIQQEDLKNYIKTNYTAERMVLVSAGGIPHDDLVKLAEQYFMSLPTTPPTSYASQIAAEQKRKPDFIGSEVRIRDDTIPTAHIAIAVEGVSWKDDDYFTALVTQAIVGNWDRAMGNSPYLGSKLSRFVHEHGLANSFMSFSTSYSDTGLWGIYLVTENKTQIDDLVHFTLREWSRLSFNVSEAETERAKAQLKASLLLSLDGTTAVAEDIGRQIVTTGRRMDPLEIERTIGNISEKDVMEFAKKKLWDQDVAVPSGFPVAGEHLTVEDRGFNPSASPSAGGVTTRNIYASLDPYLVGRMREPKSMSYFSALTLNEPLVSINICRILKSDNPKYKEGDLIVKGHLPVQQYSTLSSVLIENAKKIDPATALKDLRNYIGPLGMPGLTAYSSLYEIGKPKKGEVIFVSSAAGAVGQLVGQLANHENLTVIGSVGTEEKLKFITEDLGLDGGFNYKKEKPLDALRRLAPDGLDIYYENVGGEQLEAALEMMKTNGRIVCSGMISQYNLSENEKYGVKTLMNMIGKSLTFRGFLVSSPDFGPKWSKEHQGKVGKWIAEKTFKATFSETDRIKKAPEGFVGMLKGENLGKAVLKI